MTTPPLGRLNRVDVREAWREEARDFTPWLAQPENMAILEETLGLDLEVVGTEIAVSQFYADILCQDRQRDRKVLIENQLYKTDHTHLGQLLTYAAGLDAITVVWIAPEFTEPHRAAIDWLNRVTHEDIGFFALEIELWQIGDSPYAPKFNVVSKPNDWSKRVAESTQELSEIQQLQLDFWQQFSAYSRERGVQTHKPFPTTWMGAGISRSACSLNHTFSSWSSIRQSYEIGEISVDLYLGSSDAHLVYALLLRDRDALELALGEPLVWDFKEGRKACKIGLHREVDVKDTSRWPELIAWLFESSSRLRALFEPRIKALPRDLRDPVSAS